MALQNQIFCYSVDTAFFYNENETKIHKSMSKISYSNTKRKRRLKKMSDKKQNIVKKHIKKINQIYQKLKTNLCTEFNKNKKIRTLTANKLSNRHVIAVFESTLTRTLGIEKNTLTKDIIVVHTYYFEVFKNIVEDGFLFDGEKYVCFTASAGQIRTKKTIFIKENLIKRHANSLMCGLTLELINSAGGVNVNKYLAYLALCNSATDLWCDFDIRKSIVVDDMETNVSGLVDFINSETYKITRKNMDIPITHTDGCGMILPNMSNKSFMVRMPWVKGLLVPFDFVKFISENKTNGIIKDIYGKEWDIVKDGINVIFTKSQFKMYKYYKSWQEYCDNFVKYNCQAGKCNEEENYVSNAKINYQMLQTLSDISDKELGKIAITTQHKIDKLSSDMRTMLSVLLITDTNKNKNYIQQAVEIYPNILRDTYSKNILEQTKISLVNDGRSGRLDIDGKYVFICPDLYAFCEYLFLKNKNPLGLLKTGEVYCKTYKDKPKLDCLRSPHLYREHAVRKNTIDENKSKWFTTNGLYTSCHDLISKMLQFDNDGDCALVVADETVVKVAERNMKNIVPLFYDMAKAGSIEIDNNIIYRGLTTAYTGGNIGAISNDITKIWNSDDINLNVIKVLCFLNNCVIDYAKTLYKPEIPDSIKTTITKHTKAKVPYFFIYAKNKKKENVEIRNGSVVNRLYKIIKNSKFKFELSGIGKFNYNVLILHKDVEQNQFIIDLYEKLDIKRFSMMDNARDIKNYGHTYLDIRRQFNELDLDIQDIVSILVEYLYSIKKTNNKTTLWNSFGDILLFNIRQNVKTKYIKCSECEILVEKESNKTKYCKKCAREMQFEQKKKWDNTKRKKGDRNV